MGDFIKHITRYMQIILFSLSIIVMGYDVVMILFGHGSASATGIGVFCGLVYGLNLMSNWLAIVITGHKKMGVCKCVVCTNRKSQSTR